MLPDESRQILTRYRILFFILALIHIGLGVFYFLSPEKVVTVFNLFPIYLPLGVVTDRFSITFAANFFVLQGIFFLFLLARPRAKTHALLLLVSHLLTGGSFLYLLYYEERYFGYVVGLSFNSLVALILTWSTLRLSMVKDHLPIPTNDEESV